MAAGLVVPIAGPYVGVWNGRALGTQNDDGFVLSATWQGQEVNMTDAFGMTLVEAIWRGLNWRLRFRALEFNRPGVLNAIQAFGALGNPGVTFMPGLTQIGDRFTTFSKTLTLTAILAAIAPIPTMPATLTALSAIIAPQSNSEFLMTSKVREAPLEMVLLPYLTSQGGGSFPASFTTT